MCNSTVGEFVICVIINEEPNRTHTSWSEHVENVNIYHLRASFVSSINTCEKEKKKKEKKRFMWLCCCCGGGFCLPVLLFVCCFVASNLSSDRSHVGSLFANEEQKETGS